MLTDIQNFLILLVLATGVSLLLWQMIKPRGKAAEPETEIIDEDETENDSD